MLIKKFKPNQLSETMGGNPGENLILFVFYVSLIGIAGAIVVVIRIKISDYLADKKSRNTEEGENDNPTISN